jgi:hypothetical protein
MMRELLEGRREVGDILAALYSVSLRRWPVQVTRVCGGCSLDRDDPQQRVEPGESVSTVLWETVEPNFSAWHSALPWLDPTRALVFYEADELTIGLSKDVVRAVAWLVRDCGVQEVAIDAAANLSKESSWLEMYKHQKDGVVIHRELLDRDEPYTPLARVSVSDRILTDAEFRSLMYLQRKHHIMFLPSTTRDPDNSSRLLSDVAPNAIALSQLISVISI